MPAAPRAASAAPQRSASGTAEKEKTPLLRAAATATAPTSTGRPSPRFLGLYLWQWGLVALGALCLYGLYLVGGYFAWRRGGNGYHDVAITLGCLSGVRASQARGGCEKRACAAARHRGLLCALLSMRSLADTPPQAWCLVQVAHTLCCPGVMFTAFDDSRADRVQTAQTQTLAVGGAPAEPAERV